MAGRRSSRRAFLAGIATAGVGSIAGCLSSPSEESATTLTPSNGANNSPGTPPEQPTGRFGEVYQNTIDAVAMVHAPATGGQGSGFVFDESYLLTNEHVITGADTVELQLRNNQWAEGSVVGADVYSDIAVIEAVDLPAAATPLAQSDTRATVGQEVLALGNPFGLEESVSQGIVSGRNRSLPTGTGFRIPATIQTDASVNPGNSGGPLVTMDEQYLGVITARAGADIGFAVSWRLADRVAPELIRRGSYDHPYMGIQSRQVTPAVARANDLDEITGIIVAEVLPNEPADGILEGSPEWTIRGGEEIPVGGDVILELDDTEIRTSEDLSTYLALEKSPGETLEVTVLRNEELTTVSMELGRRPDPDQI